ncbi:MAG: head GIN domain-containing protein [Pseudomonadales bacterium]
MSRIHVSIALAMLLGAFALVASAGADRAAEMQQVDAFSKVNFGLPGELTLVKTEDPVVSIDATPKQLDDIVVEVRDGQLIIKQRRNRGWGPDLDDVKVQVGYQSLEGISVAGSGNILADTISATDFTMAIGGSGEILMQALDCETASISVAGSGDLRVNRLAADNVTTRISGSGDINLAGEAGAQTLRIAGSGDYMAEELRSAVADLTIAGSGTARVNVRERISGSVAGSGDLFYRGEPDIAVRVAGSGSVSQVGAAL